jgi:hypothetical protein
MTTKRTLLHDTRGLTSAEWLVIAAILLSGGAAALHTVSAAVEHQGDTTATAILTGEGTVRVAEPDDRVPTISAYNPPPDDGCTPQRPCMSAAPSPRWWERPFVAGFLSGIGADLPLQVGAFFSDDLGYRLTVFESVAEHTYPDGTLTPAYYGDALGSLLTVGIGGGVRRGVIAVGTRFVPRAWRTIRTGLDFSDDFIEMWLQGEGIREQTRRIDGKE